MKFFFTGKSLLIAQWNGKFAYPQMVLLCIPKQKGKGGNSSFAKNYLYHWLTLALLFFSDFSQPLYLMSLLHSR